MSVDDRWHPFAFPTPSRNTHDLRGLQEADAEGWVEFTPIFPGCYAGRWPHVHFEVYESSAANLSQVSLDSDGIFSDGYSLQMATTKRSVADGCTAILNVPI